MTKNDAIKDGKLYADASSALDKLIKEFSDNILSVARDSIFLVNNSNTVECTALANRLDKLYKDINKIIDVKNALFIIEERGKNNER